MSAPQLERIGIIAGGGQLPDAVARACEKKGIEPYIIALEGQAQPSVINGRAHIWTRMGAASTILNYFRDHSVHDIVLIGSIRRPSFAELRPDLKAMQFLAQSGLDIAGDDGILRALKSFLAREGFVVHGAHVLAEDLLATLGALGRYKPGKKDWQDIRRGWDVTQTLGQLDVGQAVVIQDGLILGVEAIEGTDELINRTGALARKGRGPILVKACKPQQDHDLDLPTIGPDTVSLAADNGFAGISVHAGQSLIIHPEEVARIADKHKLFVWGLNPQTDFSKF